MNAYPCRCEDNGEAAPDDFDRRAVPRVEDRGGVGGEARSQAGRRVVFEADVRTGCADNVRGSENGGRKRRAEKDKVPWQ